MLTCDLSLLICSLHSRTDKLTRLLECIAEQPEEYRARTQVLVDIDDAPSTGAKRNRMVAAAAGRYVAFIDDDDLITSDYLEQVFHGIDMRVDHVGVGMLYCHDGQRERVICSMHHEWGQRGGVYLRPPQHVCAVKRSIARKVRYPDVTIGEDRAYAEALKPLIESEYLTPPVYLYLWEPKC